MANSTYGSRIVDTWQRLTAPVTDEQRWPAISFLLQSMLLLCLFLFLNRCYLKGVRITEEDYFSPILLVRLLLTPRAAFLAALVMLPLVLGWKRLRWEDLGPGRTLQIVVCPLVFAIAWAFSLYDYNFYFDRSHYTDRLILVGLAALSAWRPGFVPLFLMQAFLLANQFQYPLHGFTWNDKLVVFQVLVVWTAYLFMKLIWPQFGAKPFAVLAFCLIASQYFFSGIVKFELGGWLWLEKSDLSNLFRNTHDHGMWAFLDQDSVQTMARTIAAFSQPLKVLTLVFEVGVIVALWNRWTLATLVVGLASMHVGIFITSGILFWQWMVFDIAITFLWLRLGTRLDIPLETRRVARHLPFVLSVIIVLASPFMWKQVRIGWLDTPVSGVFRIDVISVSGTVQEVVPSDLAPYDVVFAKARFYYLDDQENVSGLHGTTKDKDRFEAISKVRTPEEMFAYKQSLGISKTKDEESIRRCEDFMKKFFGNMNERHARGNSFSILSPPHHIWTYPTGGTRFRWTEPIAKVRVRYTETFFDGEQSHVFSDKLLIEIDIPSGVERDTPESKPQD